MPRESEKYPYEQRYMHTTKCKKLNIVDREFYGIVV